MDPETAAALEEVVKYPLSVLELMANTILLMAFGIVLWFSWKLVKSIFLKTKSAKWW